MMECTPESGHCHSVYYVHTGDKESVQSREITGRSQTLPWWLNGEEEGQRRQKTKCIGPRWLLHFYILHEPKFARLSLRCICGRAEAICAVFDLVWKGPDGAERVLLLLFPPTGSAWGVHCSSWPQHRAQEFKTSLVFLLLLFH
jgi:hypothetical protein